MGTQIKLAYGAERVHGIGLYDPDRLVIIDDPEHPLFDSRIFAPIDPAFADNLDMFGVLTAIEAFNAGKGPDGVPRILVVDGRMRVLHARHVNARRRKEGREILLVKATLVSGDDKRLMGTMLAANIHIKDNPLELGRKIQRYLDRGATMAEACVTLARSREGIKNLLAFARATPELHRAYAEKGLKLAPAYKLARLPPDKQKAQLEALFAPPKPKSKPAPKPKPAPEAPAVRESSEPAAPASQAKAEEPESREEIAEAAEEASRPEESKPRGGRAMLRDLDAARGRKASTLRMQSFSRIRAARDALAGRVPPDVIAFADWVLGDDEALARFADLLPWNKKAAST